MQQESDADDVREIVDLDKLPIPSLEGHQWKQFGNQLICRSCPNEHSQFLPPDLYFAGYKDGKPVLKKRHVTPSPVSPPSQG